MGTNPSLKEAAFCQIYFMKTRGRRKNLDEQLAIFTFNNEVAENSKGQMYMHGTDRGEAKENFGGAPNPNMPIKRLHSYPNCRQKTLSRVLQAEIAAKSSTSTSNVRQLCRQTKYWGLRHSSAPPYSYAPGYRRFFCYILH